MYVERNFNASSMFRKVLTHPFSYVDVDSTRIYADIVLVNVGMYIWMLHTLTMLEEMTQNRRCATRFINACAKRPASPACKCNTIVTSRVSVLSVISTQ